MAILKFGDNILSYEGSLLSTDSGPGPNPDDGYWKHKDTGVITYFDLDAPYIVLEGGSLEMITPPWVNEVVEAKVPEGVVSLGGSCFLPTEPPSALSKIVLPNSIKNIKQFSLQTGVLSDVNIPSGLEIIGGAALATIQRSSLEFPSTLTSIGDQAFAYSPLTLLKFNSTTPPTITEFTFDEAAVLETIQVPSASLSAYQAAPYWSDLGSMLVGV